MDPSFWTDKTVFITGHTGFKGSWLSLWLQQKGARVVGYSLAPPSPPSLFEKADVADGMISITGDVRDLPALGRAIHDHRPEIVIHMAAQALVRLSYDDPVETYSTNVMGTVNLLESIRKCDFIKSAVMITSDKCYENNEWIWGYREKDPMGGHDPYSSSKGCAELVSSAYARSFFFQQNGKQPKTSIATARAGNVIGGGDWSKDRLIPDIMAAISGGRPVVIRSPHAIRPWQHVLEPLRGYLMLAEMLYRHGTEYTGAWNFGPGDQDARPVSWIVDTLTRLWGHDAAWALDANTNPHEAGYLKLDCTKARQLLGWHPVVQLTTALEWIVDWYCRLNEGSDMRRVTLDQIDRYETIMAENNDDFQIN
jgi:CDP-glucose 4,6-dehydratase